MSPLPPAYRDGVPDNGQLFPDGSKITKVEWSLAGVGRYFSLDAVHRAVPHGISDRHRTRRVGLAHQLAVDKRDFAERCAREWRIGDLLG